jgi:beta-ribofuranosylaminobenzene 5'-phosphate synthase
MVESGETDELPGVRVPARVEVRAGARLHLGFLDLDGALGRRFGSIGLAIDGIATRITVTASAQPGAEGPRAERAMRCLERAAASFGNPPRAHVQVIEAIPAHIGLGSGTQLALAIGAGLARLHGIAWTPRKLAIAAGRGLRSGIGIASFAQGGLVVDGGRGKSDAPPPLVARAEFPTEWPIVLLLDGAQRGLHGAAEHEAFRSLPAFPAGLADRLCRLLMMQLLPAIAERDFASVAASIGEMQHRLGDYFAPAQGGRWTSAAVGEALDRLRRAGIAGVGQTSWGPTGFALVPSLARAGELAAMLRETAPALDIRIVTARNHGAEIVVATSGESVS